MKNYSIILSLILLFVASSAISDENITVEQIWGKREFRQNSVRGLRSMNGGKYFTKLNMVRNSIVKADYKTGEKEESVFKLSDHKDVFDKEWIFDYKFSDDESMILFSTSYEPIYRHSYKADFYLYNRESKKLSKINDDKKIQLASFSPDGEEISFFFENNLYIYNIKSGKSKQITSDGKKNKIINGAPDWVYEEEFGFAQAYKWSAGSKYIAYLKTDESNVKEFNMPIYNSLYPEQYKYKYPKAGEENSKVELYVYNKESEKSVKINLNSKGETYIPRIYPTKREGVFMAVSMNRLQNNYKMHKINAAAGISQIILEINAENYIELNDDVTFIDEYNFVMSHEDSGFRHLYKYDMNGERQAQITKGRWEVRDFYGFDKSSGEYYFQAAKESPLKREIYAVKEDGSAMRKLSEKSGTNSFKFSDGFQYYISEHSSANSPLRVSIHKKNGEEVRVLEDNKSLRDKMETHSFTKKEFFTVKAEDGTELNAWIIKPADFKKSNEYPVLMHTYGGPGSQTVTDSWDRNMAWWQMLAQKGYIIVSVDNRGTGARGREFRQVTYGDLGRVEIKDQIAAAKQLAERKYIDSDRIGMFGWSYGGYMTNLALTKGADVFSAGIAVAPVTNWRYYDTIYTERYNGLPQDNAKGYDDNSPINYVNKMKGSLLLVHGSTDDNVHFQNTMNYIDKLVSSNKQFELMVYPNRDHSIYGGGARLHLYTKMTDFIVENL